MRFDIFVLPFIAGLIFVLVFISVKFLKWILKLSGEDKILLRKHFFSKNIFVSVNEIFRESLLHRRIFKTNPLLGYMHMSLAFGWLLLILIGNLEIKFYTEYSINPPYVPIFLKFFEPTTAPHVFAKGFSFLMDLLLLFVLSGVALAYVKRFRSKSFGMSRTTKHTPYDRFALTALWFIFPLRLLAESFSSGIHDTGSFLTHNLGAFFNMFLPLEYLSYPAWWAYSLALGTFFFALPFSRYMHIPAEVLLIIFRNAGIKAELKISAFSEVEIHSCSRCGICIDNCQLSSDLQINNIQAAYFIRDVRYQMLQPVVADNCLMCGKCNAACPVGISSTQIRQIKRAELLKNKEFNFKYISPAQVATCEVVYFAGCMSHLTPGITRSMNKILDKAGLNWQFLDKDGSVCCGKPLKLAGNIEGAQKLMDLNIEKIHQSKAKILVISCPICYNAFKNETSLKIEVVHHSAFLLKLIEEEKISVDKTGLSVVYHDPCELGRHSNIYLEPRLVINQVATILPQPLSGEQAPCCGSSVGNNVIDTNSKNLLAQNALKRLGVENSDMLITSCPLCKKAFSKVSEVPVKDISELVAGQISESINEPAITARKSWKEVVVNN